MRSRSHESRHVGRQRTDDRFRRIAVQEAVQGSLDAGYVEHPAFDIERSSTRRDELLLDPSTLQKTWTLRRMIGALGNEGIEAMLTRLQRTKTNEEFLHTLNADAI